MVKGIHKTAFLKTDFVYLRIILRTFLLIIHIKQNNFKWFSGKKGIAGMESGNYNDSRNENIKSVQWIRKWDYGIESTECKGEKNVRS